MSGKWFLGVRGLALTIWLIGVSGVALGQGQSWPGAGLLQMMEAARWRVGTLRMNAAFTLSNVGYDSDVYFGYFGTDPVPDWTLAAGAPVQLLIPLSKKVVLDLSDTPQYLFYLATDRERAWNNTFSGQVHFALDKFYVRAGGGHADVRRRFSPELDINVREKRDSLDGLVLWQASRAISVALLYERFQYNYGNAEYQGTSIAERLNRNEDHMDMIAYAQPSPRTRVFLDGQYGNYTFTGEISSLQGARSYGIFAGIDFIPRVGEMAANVGLQGSFRLGYVRLDLANPELPNGSGFAGEADVTADLTNRTSVHILFSRGFQFSVYAGAAYYLSTRYGAGLSQRLSRWSTLSYDILFGQSSYPPGEDVQGLRDRYLTHTFSLNLRLARQLGVTFFGTLGMREREVDNLIHNRRFFGLSLTYGYPGVGMGPLLGRLAL